MSNKHANTDTREFDRRVNQRLSLAAHYMNAGVISWDREAYPSIVKLALKSLLMADILLDLNDKFPEGTIDSASI